MSVFVIDPKTGSKIRHSRSLQAGIHFQNKWIPGQARNDTQDNIRMTLNIITSKRQAASYGNHIITG